MSDEQNRFLVDENRQVNEYADQYRENPTSRCAPDHRRVRRDYLQE